MLWHSGQIEKCSITTWTHNNKETEQRFMARLKAIWKSVLSPHEHIVMKNITAVSKYLLPSRVAQYWLQWMFREFWSHVRSIISVTDVPTRHFAKLISIISLRLSLLLFPSIFLAKCKYQTESDWIIIHIYIDSQGTVRTQRSRQKAYIRPQQKPILDDDRMHTTTKTVY